MSWTIDIPEAQAEFGEETPYAAPYVGEVRQEREAALGNAHVCDPSICRHGGGDEVRHVCGGVVECHVAPGIEGLAQGEA